MHPASTEQLQWFKERYPGMDLEMVQFFAQTMSTFHAIGVLMEGHFGKLGLSKGRFMVMVQLHGTDDPTGLNISEVISHYPVSSATMTGIIDTLEKEGLIERLRSPEDRRRVNVRITPRGREFMDEFLPLHHRYMQQFSEALTIRERKTLLRLLTRFHTNIAEVLEEEDAPPAEGIP